MVSISPGAIFLLTGFAARIIMRPMQIKAFLARVDKYCAKSGAPEWKASKALFADARSLPRLRAGWRGISVERLETAALKLAELEATAPTRGAAQKKRPRRVKNVALRIEEKTNGRVKCRDLLARERA